MPEPGCAVPYGTEPCRAVPCRYSARTEPYRAVPCRAVHFRAKPSRAVLCLNRTVPCRSRTGPYCTVPYRAMPCQSRTGPFCAVPFRTGPFRTVPYRAMPFRTVPYRTVPYRTVPYRTVPYRAIPYRSVPFHTVPCRAVPALTPIPPCCEVGASPQQGALPGPGTSTPGGCPRNPPEDPGPCRALPQLPAAPTRPLVLQGAEVLKPRSLLPKKQAKQTKSANISQIFPKYFPEHPPCHGRGASCSGRTELPGRCPRV